MNINLDEYKEVKKTEYDQHKKQSDAKYAQTLRFGFRYFIKKQKVFELSKDEEEKFRELSLSIKPTDIEVECMTEYDWITTIYPRRIFKEIKDKYNQARDKK
jgi:hypothetical protein